MEAQRVQKQVIKRRVRIEPDTCAENPREDADGRVGTMVSLEWLADAACEVDPEIEHLSDKIDDMWDNDEEYTPEYQLRISARGNRIADAIAKSMFILELHYSEHGPQCSLSVGTTWVTGADEDDSVDGYIYVTREQAAKAYGIDEWTPETEQRVMTYLQGEVEIYDKWMQGDVYGFICEELYEGDDPDSGWVEIDSCWGFCGSDPDTNGMKDHWSDVFKADDVEVVCE